MFWLGFIIIPVIAFILTEIMIIIMRPFITMVESKKVKKAISNQLSETDYTIELLTQSDDDSEEYYNEPILVSSYTVDLNGVKDQIQNIKVDEIETLDFEEDENIINQSENLI